MVMDVGTQQVYDNDLDSLEEGDEGDLPQRNLFGFFDADTTTTTAPSTTAPSTIASTSTASTSTSGAHQEDPDAQQHRRPSRTRMPTAHYMHSKHAGWSEYELGRSGQRHERTREDVANEATTARRFYGLLVRVGIVSPGSIHVLAAHAAAAAIFLVRRVRARSLPRLHVHERGRRCVLSAFWYASFLCAPFEPLSHRPCVSR